MAFRVVGFRRFSLGFRVMGLRGFGVMGFRFRGFGGV